MMKAIQDFAMTRKYLISSVVVPLCVGFLYAAITFSSPTLDQVGSKSGVFVNSIVGLLVLLQIIIWMVAARGAAMIKTYAIGIKESEDGKALNLVSNALIWMVVYIMLVSVTASLVNYFAGSNMERVSIVLRNHLPLVAMVLSVAYLYAGSRRLLRFVDLFKPGKLQALIIAAIFTAAALFFLNYFYAQLTTEYYYGAIPRFVIPAKLLLFTYVLPHIVLWAFGLLAIMNIAHYADNVEGKIYRALFKNLYRGVAMVFASIFTTQIIIATTVNVSGINIAVVIIFGIVTAALWGFTLVYRGAQNLVRLEISAHN